MGRGGCWEGQKRSNVAPRLSSSLLLMQRALSQERLSRRHTKRKIIHSPSLEEFAVKHLELHPLYWG